MRIPPIVPIVRLSLALIALCAAAPQPALAGTVPDLVEKADDLFADGALEDAATQLGKAAALAHKKNDVESERAVAATLDTLLREAKKTQRKGVQRTVSSSGDLTEIQRLLIVRVVEKIDAKRSAAFVSAPALARRLLLAASEHGDFEHVDTARKVLAVHAAQRGCGSAANTYLQYADGVIAQRDDKLDLAAKHLRAAYTDAADQGWLDLAGHAGTTLAWVQWSQDDQAGAEATLRAVAALFEGDVSGETARAWTRVVQAGLPEGATELAEIVNQATRELTPQASDPTGDSDSSGKSKLTRLGKAYKKLGGKSPLTRVERGELAWQIAVLFKPKSKTTEQPRSGARRLNLGGLRLVLRDQHIAVERLELQNYDNFQGAPMRRAGEQQPALRPAGHLTLCRADYPLARGETWTVTKAGTIRIE